MDYVNTDRGHRFINNVGHNQYKGDHHQGGEMMAVTSECAGWIYCGLFAGG